MMSGNKEDKIFNNFIEENCSTEQEVNRDLKIFNKTSNENTNTISNVKKELLKNQGSSDCENQNDFEIISESESELKKDMSLPNKLSNIIERNNSPIKITKSVSNLEKNLENLNLKEKNSLKNETTKLDELNYNKPNKQTWQKQLLQTQFFKSITTQQLLSHYNQNHLELPDKIMNTDDSDPDEPLLSGSGNVPKECSDDMLQSWSQIIIKWKIPNQRPSGLKELIKHGIPQTFRGKVWQLLVEGYDDDAIIETYRVLITKESAFEVNIERDINRTFPANDYFKKSGSLGQGNLFKLCKAYSIFDEEIGYCQGLTFIGAALLLHMPEEQSFVVLVRIMHDYGLRNLFRSAFEDLHLRFYQLDRLIEEQIPDLYNHFNNLGIETHMFASQWFLTLFTAKFPLHLVYYILDLFLYNKFNTIFQVSVALLTLSTSELLKLDFEGVLKYFRVYLPKKYKSDANARYLLKTAFSVKLKKLEKYEKDYKLYKESKINPIDRLTKENQRLQNSILRLEQENDSLAQVISVTKLSMRSQLDASEDKVDQLTTELHKTNKYLNELEEEKKLLLVQVNKLKELCRRELDYVENEANQKDKIGKQYKEICSKLSKRLENNEQFLEELKSKISSCDNCKNVFEENSLINENKNDLSNKTDEDQKNEYEKRIHDLEIELAQTKLELVEAKCNNQALMHKMILK